MQTTLGTLPPSLCVHLVGPRHELLELAILDLQQGGLVHDFPQGELKQYYLVILYNLV